MEKIKPKKERKFLKAMGDIALTLFRELVLGIGKKVINKVGNKRQGLVIAFALVAGISYASIDSIPYPITGNKQRLGWQTSGNGLVYRGRAADTITKPSSYVDKNVKAYLLVDSVLGTIFVWRQTYWDSIKVNTRLMPFDSITFNTAKNGTVGVGEVEYNDTHGSLIQGLKGGNVTNVIGQQLHQRVNNRTGAPLAKGDVVYLAGSQGNRITVAKGLAVTDAFSANTFGVVAEAIANNASGFIITEGLITGLNTSALTEDSAVYLSPTVAGALTSTKPQAPQHTVYIGVCVKSNNGSGELFVKIRNGLEMDELHDTRITNPVTGATLYFLGGLWRDTTAALLVSDTASMLTPYLRKADTASISNRINLKVNISDTLNMLVPYLRKADTTNMLLPYFRDADTSLLNLTSRFNTKLNISDAASTYTPLTRSISTTSPLQGGGDLSANRTLSILSASDIQSGVVSTTAQLFSGSKVFKHRLTADSLFYLNNTSPIPTAILGIDLTGGVNSVGKFTLGNGLSITSSTLLADTILLVTRFDTASMLTPYFRDADTSQLNLTSRFSAKLNLLDTLNMLVPYLRKADTTLMLSKYLRSADTSLLNLTSRFATKVNISDTAAMLSNYNSRINTKLNISDTLSMLAPYFRDADTSLLNLNSRFATKLNISDTSSMLSKYLSRADTSLLNLTSRFATKLNISDTAAMLSNYNSRINLKLNISDTTNMLVPYLRKADTTLMLSKYLRSADTTLLNLTSRFATKLNLSDTASMLTNYLRTGVAANTYLPLTGGTLTGGLTGISLNLSSTLNSTGDIFFGSNSSYSGLKTRYFKTTDISPNRDLFIGSVGTIGTWAGRMHFQTSYNTEVPTTAMTINEFGNINMNGTLGVTGATTLGSTLAVTGNITEAGNNVLTSADTTSMLLPYLRKADTTNMLLPYFRDADTTSLNLTSRFAAKQNTLTNPVTGTGTNNFLPKFTTTGSIIGNSTIQDNGTTVSTSSILSTSNYASFNTTQTIGNSSGINSTHRFTSANANGVYDKTWFLTSYMGAPWQGSDIGDGNRSKPPIVAIINNNDSNLINSGLHLMTTKSQNNTYTPALTFGVNSESGIYYNTIGAITAKKLNTGQFTSQSAGQLEFFGTGTALDATGASMTTANMTLGVGVGIGYTTAPTVRGRLTVLEKLGINQSTPAFALDVSGTANITGATTLGSTLAVTGDITKNGNNVLTSADTTSMLLPYWRSGNFSGVLPVLNGGTNRTTMPNNYILFGDGNGIDTSNQLFWDRTNNRLGVGTNNPIYKLDVQGSSNTVNMRMASNTANDILLYFTGNVTGDINMFQSAVNATGSVSAEFVNANTATGSAFLNMQVPNTSTGDPFLQFTTSGATNYSFGIDNSDSDKFKFHSAATPSNSAIAIYTLTTDGKFGIQTESPSEVLHVVGNARITENIAAGVTSATARLHLAAGTATAGTAPLKFTSGVNLTSPLGGEMEFNGTNLFFSPSTTRHTVNHGLTGSATLNFPSTTTLLSADLTITVTGAADGDVVSLGVPNAAVNANTCYTAWVSAANTVTVRFNNYSSGTVDPASGTFKVFVTK